jgi:hypothetical protein
MHSHEDLIHVLFGRGTNGCLFSKRVDHGLKTGAFCSLGGRDGSFKCPVVIQNFAQIIVCSASGCGRVVSPYGLTTLPQPPVYLEQCFSICFSRVPLPDRTHAFYWVLKILIDSFYFEDPGLPECFAGLFHQMTVRVPLVEKR